ncbi:MAG: hypothetical protein E7322_00955 [Clostridiales bacterium]|nr:hypothetical protein [Clostridiales bacterium]
MNVKDKRIIRALAARVSEISKSPAEAKKREMWRNHTSLKGSLPPVFVSPEGSWAEILPEESLACEDAFAREIELELRKRLFRYDVIKDDTPIENIFDFPVSMIPVNEHWGLPVVRVPASGRGSWRHVPVVEDVEDWKKLKMPSLDIDEAGAKMKQQMLMDAAGDLLCANITGIKIFDFHIAHIYADFRGLDNLLIDLADDIDMVKDVFEFMGEGLMGLVKQAQSAHLIQRNDDHTYHYTGGLGYTYDLPDDSVNGADTQNVWAACEAQEFSCVSPRMFAETILPVERKLLEPFGLNGYGCCDDLTEKLDSVLTIKNLRRVAACPWANLKKMADRLKKDYILTWKPNPAYLAGEIFDDNAVEDYLIQSLTDAKAGYPEIILRDTHSVRNDPIRFQKFVTCARSAIEKVYGQ